MKRHLDKEKKYKRYKYLLKFIKQCDDAYFIKSESIVSDAVYDAYKEELNDLQALFSNDLNHYIGAGHLEEQFVKIKHDFPMLSLSKCWHEKEFLMFHKRVKGATMIAQPKVDGVSISIKYKSGKLAYMVTRGDGTSGECLNHHIGYIKDIPKNIPYPLEITCRGEVFINKTDFLEYYPDLSGKARNIASGILRRKDTSPHLMHRLSCVFYTVLGNDAIHTQEESILFLQSMGFKTLEYAMCGDFRACTQYFDNFNGKLQRHYETDGIVYKVNDNVISYKLGNNSKYPKWATAYKFGAKVYETTLEDIIYSPSKEGALIPTATFEEICIDGYAIKKASLHNFKYVQDRALSKGTKMGIKMSGGVIPAVEYVEESNQHLEQFSECSCPCGSKASIISPHAYCTNASCPYVLEKKIMFLCSKEAFNIKGIGISTIRSLIKNANLRNIADVFFIKKEHLLSLPNYSEVKASKVLSSIERAIETNIDLDIFLNALSIKGVGTYVSKQLSRHFSSLDDLLSFIVAKKDTEINGVGNITLSNIKRFFEDKHNLAIAQLVYRIQRDS